MDAEHVQYEIRVGQHLGPAIAALFPEFTLTEEEGDTVMRGTLPDQAALHGVLTRIRDLGLMLLALAQVTDPPELTGAGDGA